MAKGAGETVKFLRYNGYLSDFTKDVVNNAYYDNYVVFALLLENKESTKVILKIYAGKDKNGWPYLYDMCGCSGGSASIIVDTYSDAEAYLATPEAAAGQLITTTEDNKTYIILPNEEGGLQLVAISGGKCKWEYAEGAGTEGSIWHNAEAIITNPMGMIGSNWTLGQLIEYADGDFSRLIETLLFKPVLPVIGNISIVPAEENPLTGIVVNCDVTDSTDVKVYINTSATKDGATVKDKDGNNPVEFDDLTDDTTYYVLIEATNELGTTSSNWTMVKTSAYVKPTVNAPSLTLAKSGYDVKINNISGISLSAGSDYEIDTVEYTLKSGDTIIVGPKDDINELKVNNLDYNTAYTVVANYTIKTTDGKKSETGTSTSSSKSYASVVSCTVELKSGEETSTYTKSQTEAIDFSDKSNIITIALTPDYDYATGRISVKYNGNEIYSNTEAADNTKITDNSLIITLPSADDAKNLVVTATDEAGKKCIISLPLKYKLEIPDRYTLQYIAVPMDGNIPDENYSNCLTLIDDALLNEDDDYEIYYYTEAGQNQIVETIDNIKTLDAYTAENGDIYYKYVPNYDLFGENGVYGTIMVICNDSNVIEIYPPLDPNTPKLDDMYNVIKAENTLAYPELESVSIYSVNYIETDLPWQSYGATNIFWIKIS